MDANKLPAGQGLQWYVCGWNLFRPHTAVWLLFGIILLGVAAVCFSIPGVGPLLFMFLTPLLAAGFYIAAQSAYRGGVVELGMLFQGFTRPEIRTPLMILGGVLLGLLIAGAIVMMLLGIGMMGGSMGAVGGPGAGMHPPEFFSMAVGAGLLVGLVVQVLIAMCMYFAIPLVTLDGVQPVAAVKASFQASATNILPFLVFVISYMILAFIAALPFFLGFIVLAPIAFCAIYCAYQGVYK